VKRRTPVVALAALALALAACRTPASSVSDRTYAPTAPALERVAVIPFYPHRSFAGERVLGGETADVATQRVTEAIATAIADRGVDVLTGADLDVVVSNVARIAPAVDARIFAELAERELGVTGVVLGEVLRYRNSLATTSAPRRPASVAFQLALYEAPAGAKVWAARFDETQEIEEPDLVADPDETAPPEPGRSADELARKGAFEAADRLLSTR